MSTTVHLYISVRGMLNWPAQETKRNLRWITKKDGTRYSSVGELREALMDKLAQGHETLPMSPECDRHDWKKGCTGHEVPDIDKAPSYANGRPILDDGPQIDDL